jgi:AcrR family transcriptional regulator
LVQTRQLSREDWLKAARLAMVSSGIGDVKVDRLAKKLGVTRGSFYWHFKDHKDLLDALLQDWEVRNQYEIAQVRTRWARSDPDLSEIVAIWLGADPTFPAYDMAIRIWARKSPEVAAAVNRVDDAWVGLIEELFRREHFDEDEVFVRARVVYFHQIGYHALAIREDLDERLRLAPFYYKALTGKEPGDKFRATIAEIAEQAAASRTKRVRKRTAAAATAS